MAKMHRVISEWNDKKILNYDDVFASFFSQCIFFHWPRCHKYIIHWSWVILYNSCNFVMIIQGQARHIKKRQYQVHIECLALSFLTKYLWICWIITFLCAKLEAISLNCVYLCVSVCIGSIVFLFLIAYICF
jgi:hypothetical protein